jgi:hypothetical protein
VSANPSDEIVEQLKQQLDLTERQLGTTKQRLQYAELKIQVLEERLRLKRIQMYGPGSEKLSNEQLELLELEPGVSTAEVQAESAREPVRRRKEFASIRVARRCRRSCRGSSG